MKIELGQATFQPIVITIENEADATMFTNLMLLAQENQTIVASEHELANGFLAVISPDNVTDFEAADEVEIVDIPDDAPSL